MFRVSYALQHQLKAMFRTINSVAPFLFLLGLFVFIFVVLGMVLFGCEFCTNATTYYNYHFSNVSLVAKPEGNIMADTSVVAACKSYHRRRQDDFHTLLSSLLTVLRVVTQDDGWSQVMRETMFYTSSYWPALYFISLQMIGVYILLAMLLGLFSF